MSLVQCLTTVQTIVVALVSVLWHICLLIYNNLKLADAIFKIRFYKLKK